MAEWRRVQVELAKSRTEVSMEETKANAQFKSIPLKSLEKTMTLKATSHTQVVTKIEQPPHLKDMSIEELVAQYMNEEQQRSLPNILKVKPEKEDVDNNEWWRT